MRPEEGRMEDALDRSKLRFVDVGGIRTRYYEDGEGEPLVLIHGGHFGFVDSLDTWSLNLKGLARHFRVLALDRVGQGYTGSPTRDDDYTQDFTLRHVLQWLNVVGLEQAHLLGHSRGGLVAAQVALERPGFAKSAVIVNSATLAPESDDPRFACGAVLESIGVGSHVGPWTRDELRVEPESDSFSHTHITAEYIDRYLEMVNLPSFREAEAKMRDGLANKLFKPNLNLARAEALRRVDERGMPCRTLLIWSFNDNLAPLREVGLRLYDRICAKTPVSDLYVFNQAGHYPYREHPLEFNRIVTAFCLS